MAEQRESEVLASLVQTMLSSFDNSVNKRQQILQKITDNPLLAKEAFGSLKPSIKIGTRSQLINLRDRAAAGDLSEAEKSFVRKESLFSGGQRLSLFNTLLADAPRIRGRIQAREQVEAERKARPGRTQTILTRRE